MYCFFNKFFFKVEILGNLPIFCHAHLVAIQNFVNREILFDRSSKCPMLCLFFYLKGTIGAVKSAAHVMPCFMCQHSAFLCGGLAFAAINDKEIVKERDCEIVFEFNIVAARKIERNQYYATHGGLVTATGKLTAEDFRAENRSIFGALPAAVREWAGSPAGLVDALDRSNADLLQYVKPGFVKAVDAAKDADRMPPALPGGAKAQIGG